MAESNRLAVVEPRAPVPAAVPLRAAPEPRLHPRPVVFPDWLDERRVRRRTRSAYTRLLKPLLDWVGALLLLALLSVPLAVVLVAVRVTMGRHVIFRQRRVGKDQQVFTIYKIRTMRHPSHGGEPRLTELEADDDDPRHTWLGRKLRRTSFDEVPQLINVLRGEMSLVGPRPEILDLVELHDLWDHPRHLVKPGLTGLWQCSAWRDLPIYETASIDNLYLTRMSLLEDGKILVKTVCSLSTARR